MLGDAGWRAWRRARYRVLQFKKAVGASLAPLSPAEETKVRAVLPDRAWPLFAAMPRADQRHSLEVWRTLSGQGRDAPALTQAALLHDCAKHRGGITLAHRVAVVLLRAFRPELLATWAEAPVPGPGGWRQPFWAHAHHPGLSAALAEAAGCDPIAVALIRRHQVVETDDTDDASTYGLLAALQAADDDN